MSENEGREIVEAFASLVRIEPVGRPRCLHPVFWVLLTLLAGADPDAGDRQRVQALASRLSRTTSTSKVVSVRLAIFFAEQVLLYFETAYPGDKRPRRALEAAKAWYDDPSPTNTAEVEAAVENAATVVEATRGDSDAAHWAASAAESAALTAGVDVADWAATFRADYLEEVQNSGADPAGLGYAYGDEAEELHRDSAAAAADGAFGALLNANQEVPGRVLLHRLLEEGLAL